MQERSSANKWLIGCGIGCGVFVLILIILATGGYLLCRGTVQQVQDLAAVQDSLRVRYGRLNSYIPSADGRIAPDRIELFLAIRKDVLPAARDLTSLAVSLSQRDKKKQEGSSLSNVLRGMKDGLSLIPRFAEFNHLKMKTLLDSSMHPGEYYYYYILSYYSYLGKKPWDSPAELELSANGTVFYSSRDTTLFDPQDRTAGQRSGKQQLLREIRDTMISIMKNQYSVAKGGLPASGKGWPTALERELGKLRQDPMRLPWQDGLPWPLKDSLMPFRKELETSYDPGSNFFEMIFSAEFN